MIEIHSNSKGFDGEYSPQVKLISTHKSFEDAFEWFDNFLRDKTGRDEDIKHLTGINQNSDKKITVLMVYYNFVFTSDNETFDGDINSICFMKRARKDKLTKNLDTHLQGFIETMANLIKDYN